MSGQSLMVAMRATTARSSFSTTGRARMLRKVRDGWRMALTLSLGRLSRCRLDTREFLLELTRGVPEVVTFLHVQIEVGRPGGEPAEPERHLGRDAALAAKDGIERWPAHAHSPRRLRNRDLQVLDENFAHQLARMRGRSLPRPGGILGHLKSPNG